MDGAEEERKEGTDDPNLNNVENAGNGAREREPIWLGKGICGVVKWLPEFLSFKGETRPRMTHFGLFIWPLCIQSFSSRLSQGFEEDVLEID